MYQTESDLMKQFFMCHKNFKMPKQRTSRSASNRSSRAFAAAFARVPVGTEVVRTMEEEAIPENPEILLRDAVQNVRVTQDAAAVENTQAAATNTTQNNNNNNHNNDDGGIVGITLDTIRDSIVSAKTYASYIGDLGHFLKWVALNEYAWLTEYGGTRLAEIETRNEDESVRSFRSRRLVSLKALLRDAYDQHVVHVDAITPNRYMDYVLTISGRQNRFLSPSAYGSKRAALYHLFRLHNRIGFPASFKLEIGNLYKGFYRKIAQHRNSPANNINNNNNEVQSNNSDGKQPMSVEMYKSLCGWLLDFGTIDGVFAYAYLVITWNLACRARNTATIRFRDISWSSSFDAFAISFAHSKTDQLGEESKYMRHLYSNPNVPLVCPVLALSMYLSSCVNTAQDLNDFLFPGSEQETRFGKILKAVLGKKGETVSQLGYAPGDLGSHSIRKGAVSYLASLPGGPPSAAICIRAGWTMGKIKDIYMRYVTSGDQFVGRCLSLLPILRSDFGCSPPHFVGVNDDDDWVDGMRCSQFPMVSLIAGFGRLTLMCLAGVLYHRDWIRSRLDANHVFLVTSNCFRDGDLLKKLDDNKELLMVTYPWNDNNAFSGIPPMYLFFKS
jgi:hypothetical protein